MNIIFGSAFASSGDESEMFCDELKATYPGANPQLKKLSKQMYFGSMDDGGVITGVAHDDRYALVMLHSLQEPLQEWVSGSPLDDPSKTASHVLELYKKHGDSMLDHLYGQFALAIFDIDKKMVILAADREGIRSLYYVILDGVLYFSSNLYHLARSLRKHLDYDRSAEDFFLIHGVMPDDGTFFKGVKTLSSGSVLSVTPETSQKRMIEHSNPWETYCSGLDWPAMTEERAIDVLYDRFMTATEEQSASSDRAAVLLGGFDSSLVAAALQKLGKKVETFTYQYSEESYNQPNVDTLQSFLGHRHHWIQVTEEDIGDGLANYAYRYNKPTNWPNYVIQTDRLCRAIREQGILHCYTGDGCDDVFLGYPVVHLRAKLFSLPALIPKAIMRGLTTMLRPAFIERMTGHVYAVVLNVLRSFARTWPEKGYMTFRVFDENSLDRLRSGEVIKQAASIDEILSEMVRDMGDLSPDRLAYLGKFLINPNWVKMVGSSDGTGISIHSPYIHSGMVQFAREIPDDLCRPPDTAETRECGKYILMKMAEKKGLLPHESIYQRKFPAVNAPIDTWYAGPLRDLMTCLVAGLPFKPDMNYVGELIDPKLVEKIYKKYCSLDDICSSHPVSLLVTYASFTQALKEPSIK